MIITAHVLTACAVLLLAIALAPWSGGPFVALAFGCGLTAIVLAIRTLR